MALRRLARSIKVQKDLGHYHPTEFAALIAFTFGVAAVFTSAALMLGGHAWFAAWSVPAKAALYLTALLGLNCVAYGVLVEPYRVVLKRIRLTSPKIGGPALRIAHLSDCHVRGWSTVEAQAVAHLKAAAPDLIVITGDNTARPCSMRAVRRFYKEVSEVAPTFLIRGDSEHRPPEHRDETEGSSGVWLEGATRTLEVKGTTLFLAGVDRGDEPAIFELAKRAPAGAYRICLYHYPDFFADLAEVPYDLMLSGHTHGGQVRLPGIGALISQCRPGTRYAGGLFKGGDTFGYANFGLGCEGYGLPRLRFLCPPEVVVFELRAG